MNNLKMNHKEKYEQKRKVKKVSFNLETESELFDYANSLDFSIWAKDKLKAEMKKPT